MPLFAKKFNTSNFLFCWYYVDGYLDVDNSSPMGVYFMQKVVFVGFILDHYANLCTQVKIATDTEDVLPHTYQRLLEFYELPLAKSTTMSSDAILELTERCHGQRVSKRKPVHYLADVRDRNDNAKNSNHGIVPGSDRRVRNRGRFQELAGTLVDTGLGCTKESHRMKGIAIVYEIGSMNINPSTFSIWTCSSMRTELSPRERERGGNETR